MSDIEISNLQQSIENLQIGESIDREINGNTVKIECVLIGMRSGYRFSLNHYKGLFGLPYQVTDAISQLTDFAPISAGELQLNRLEKKEIY